MLLRKHERSESSKQAYLLKSKAPQKVEPLLTNPSMNKTKVKSSYRIHQKQKSGVVQ